MLCCFILTVKSSRSATIWYAISLNPNSLAGCNRSRASSFWTIDAPAGDCDAESLRASALLRATSI